MNETSSLNRHLIHQFPQAARRPSGDEDEHFEDHGEGRGERGVRKPVGIDRNQPEHDRSVPSVLFDGSPTSRVGGQQEVSAKLENGVGFAGHGARKGP